MEIDRERIKLLEQLAEGIMSEMANQGFTGFENVSDEAWAENFLEKIHPALDQGIGDYALGAHEIFYIGVYLGAILFWKRTAR